MKKKMAIFFLLISAILLLLSCKKEEERKEKKKIKIGISLYDSYDTFISDYMKAFDGEVAEKRSEGYEVSVARYNAARSQALQNEQIEEMLQNSCDVLCVNLVDRTAPSEIIDMAKKKNVPVIFFNRELVEEDLSQWNRLYYVGADAKQSGVLQGELIAEDILEEGEGENTAVSLSSEVDKNGDGKIQYLIFEGEPGHQDAIMRTEYATGTLLKESIPLERLGYGIANWNRAEAQSKMMQLYSEFQDRIELIISNNDDMALGVIDAYDKIAVPKDNRPYIYGIDGTKVGLMAVENGNLRATVYNDRQGQAKALFQLAFQLASGDGGREDSGIRKIIRLPYSKVTKDNCSDFLEEEDRAAR